MQEANIHTFWTRLPFILRSTTRECAHFVTGGHFRSRDKDGGHTIWSAISENPILHAKLMALSFCYRTGVMVDWNFTLRE